MLLETKKINKSFHNTQVLFDVDFKLDKGEICGLVGQNGAGKSTFSNIISGLLKADSGEIYFEGEKINNETILEKQSRGIFMVPQNSTIVMEFSVAENLFVGKWFKKNIVIDKKEMEAKAVEFLEEYNFDVEPSTKAKDLSLVDRRKLNIIRALFSDAKMVILDEPTTSLRKEERDNLFRFIKELSDKGVSFIFISHYLDEVIELCDSIAVFRNGHMTNIFKKEETNELNLSKAVVGEEVSLHRRGKGFAGNEKTVRCEKIVAEGVEESSFILKYGRIVGFIGFPGSGARETMRTLAGLNPIKRGRIYDDNCEFEISNPKKAKNNGIMYIPFDRHDEGLVQEMSILKNIGLSKMDNGISNRFGVINKKKEEKNTKIYYEKLNIKAKNPNEIVRTLSGGNQQKVLIAKVLCCNPRILILDEPTIGIDIGSREEILSLVDDLAKEGMAVIYHTSDYAEMLRICDSIAFFNNGRYIDMIDNKGLTIEKLSEIRDSFI